MSDDKEKLAKKIKRVGRRGQRREEEGRTKAERCVSKVFVARQNFTCQHCLAGRSGRGGGRRAGERERHVTSPSGLLLEL